MEAGTRDETQVKEEEYQGWEVQEQKMVEERQDSHSGLVSGDHCAQDAVVSVEEQAVRPGLVGVEAERQQCEAC